MAAVSGQRRAARRGQPDVAFDNDIGRAANQQQVLDIVAAHQNQPAMAVDCGGIHDGQPRLAVPAAGDKSPESQVADELDDQENDDQQDKRGKRPQECRGIAGTRHAIEPLQHWFPLSGL